MDGTQHDITDPTDQASRVACCRTGRPMGRASCIEDSGFGSNDDGRGVVRLLTVRAAQFTIARHPGLGARWSPDGLTILSQRWESSTTSMFITDPTGVRPQTVIDVSDLHAGQFSMSWQRVAP